MNLPIDEISEDVFDDLVNLKRLEIWRTNIQELHVNLLQNLRKLETFDAKYNKIT